ncbi:MAG: flagellar hook-associated protein FlgL [Deltaproteobacteria bacterium]|nr:flagellar hook-associated protein FlgL [Deltaproteobacteria bacterium]
MRVSDNTSAAAVGDSLKRTRTKMEKLQIQNATQKKLLTPSDDPAANTKIMDIRTDATINSQFENNAALAKTRLSATDNALNELSDIFTRAKEIAIGQSSDGSASADSRLGVAQEVANLYQQLVSVANRRVGQHYIFGGFKTLAQPYDHDGEFKGDTGEIPVEIQKNVFIGVNVPGPQVFEAKKYRTVDAGRTPAALERDPQTSVDQHKPATGPTDGRQPAAPAETVNIFRELDQLRVGLMTNDTATIRDTMEHFDTIIQNLITTRAKISSRVAGIDATISSTQRTDATNAELATQLEDADYAELWSNLAKEETVLKSSLHAAQKLIQPTLLDFLR